jgi:hypothetical protein
MRLSEEQFFKLIEKWSELLEKREDLRKGQSLFIALSDIYPEIANEIRGGEFDPFYEDSKIPDCFQRIVPL